MPLRNERQAYWDDIENHIARVQPLTASQALDRVCPDAAAERLALKSRLRDVEEQTRQVHRLRARAAAEADVLAREADAALDLESKERAFEEARMFVRGRLQNDRPDGQRLGMRAPERLARAALGAPREDRLRAAAPFAVASPAAHAEAHRERNERWGSGEVSPLMGGGYTVVLQRAAADREDAAERREKAERERALYFMESSVGRDHEMETRVSGTFRDSLCHANDTMNRTSAANALRGWEPEKGKGKKAGRERARRDDDDDDDDDESVLPLPRDSTRDDARRTSKTSNSFDRGTTGVSSVSHVSHGHASIGTSVSHARGKRGSTPRKGHPYGSSRGSGYGAQLALVGNGSSVAAPPTTSRASGVGRLLR
jgi:hypothetical protein